MASVLIRNVDDALHKRLKDSALVHRRSLEEEARELLREAVARQSTGPKDNLADIAERLFGEDHAADLDIPPRGSAPRRPAPDFSSPATPPKAK